MLNTILCIIFQGAVSPFWAIAFEKMLDCNHKFKSWHRLLAWTVALFILCVLKISFVNSAIMQIFAYVFALSSIFVFMKVFYKDPVWKKIIAVALLFLCAFLADFVVQSLYQMFITDDYAWHYDNPHLVVISFLVTLMTVIIYVVMSSAWCKVFKKTKVINRPLVFILLLVAEFCAIMPSTYMVFKDGTYLFEFDFMIVSSLIVIFTLAYILYDQSKKDVIQNEFKNVKYIMELEKTHYTEVEKRRSEMSKLHSEYEEFISSTLFLLNNNDLKRAEDKLQQFSEKVDLTKEKPFCHIPVINSILSEKERQCNNENIKLTVNLILPQSISVTQLELCSVLGNLLDNSIKACRKLGNNVGREIQLYSGISGNYIIFECINPAVSGVKSVPDGTGYGFKILNSYAKKYNGDFRTNFNDGYFTARLTLLNLVRGDDIV